MTPDVHDAVLLDLDGVVYAGDTAVPGAPEALARLREEGTPLRFVTNNASRTPGQVAEKLVSVGVRAEGEEVLGSARAAGASCGCGGCAILRRSAVAISFVVTDAAMLGALRPKVKKNSPKNTVRHGASQVGRARAGRWSVTLEVCRRKTELERFDCANRVPQAMV